MRLFLVLVAFFVLWFCAQGFLTLSCLYKVLLGSFVKSTVILANPSFPRVRVIFFSATTFGPKIVLVEITAQ